MAYPQGRRSRENGMRFLLGLILGCALTIGGAYVADVASAPSTPMVNWEVVAKNVGAVTALAREGWKKITG
jgi:hypothetical protein